MYLRKITLFKFVKYFVSLRVYLRNHAVRCCIICFGSELNLKNTQNTRQFNYFQREIKTDAAIQIPCDQIKKKNQSSLNQLKHQNSTNQITRFFF
jgi:hypothetical protein